MTRLFFIGVSILVHFVLCVDTLKFDIVALATLSYKEDGAPADWGVDALHAAELALESVNDLDTGILGKDGKMAFETMLIGRMGQFLLERK